jgi:hypothetical protein
MLKRFVESLVMLKMKVTGRKLGSFGASGGQLGGFITSSVISE